MLKRWAFGALAHFHFPVLANFRILCHQHTNCIPFSCRKHEKANALKSTCAQWGALEPTYSSQARKIAANDESHMRRVWVICLHKQDNFDCELTPATDKSSTWRKRNYTWAAKQCKKMCLKGDGKREYAQRICRKVWVCNMWIWKTKQWVLADFNQA